MRTCIALALTLALAAPAIADAPRPLPRPVSVERLAAFAGATELAPRSVVRPRNLSESAASRPDDAPAVPLADAGDEATPLAPRVVLRPLPGPAAFATVPDLAARVVLPRSGPAFAPDPIPDPARALGSARGVTLSASNARAPVFVTDTLALPRPARRPDTGTSPGTVPEATPIAIPRPRTRPETVTRAAFTVAPGLSAPTITAAISSPRPAPRPRGLADRAATAKAKPVQPTPEKVTLAAAAPRIDPGKTLVVPKKGAAICGDSAIQGTMLPPITSQVKGCGIAAPVRVTSVDGVRLSTPATLDCATARALRQWVSTGLKPAAGKAGVSEIHVAAHYACRPRNNVKGARVSEHGRGKAIDIAGVRLANGQMLSVLGDYRRAELLQKVRRAACGIFGTTLGPGSDRHHSDHFHFDTASHRSGPYCR
ncbi:MAG: extensin family protein [Gemmobacter sp.]